MNGKAWRALPPDLQAVLANNMNGAVLKARADFVELNKTVADDLKKNGMIFNDTDPTNSASRYPRTVTTSGGRKPSVPRRGRHWRNSPARWCNYESASNFDSFRYHYKSLKLLKFFGNQMRSRLDADQFARKPRFRYI
jgi:hypothetical protein